MNNFTSYRSKRFLLTGILINLIFEFPRDWDSLKLIMNDTVYLDYSSMTGEKPDELPLQQIIDSWKELLPGFDATHHQLGNYLVEEEDPFGRVFCYGTAIHYLKNESAKNLWTVAGTYEFKLNSEFGSWRITAMKFRLKFMDGNMDLPKLAQDKLKAQVQ
jgi:hypothetical protein